ncbi:MAG: hypothetical protein LBD59_10830 [Prevotellaceae bacterium]|jgi:hypothetical protein|nr:hypothetical protein [Prevotellaceae bacterium]
MQKKYLQTSLIILMIVGMCACRQKSEIELAEKELVQIVQKGYWYEFKERLQDLLLDDDNSWEYPFKKLKGLRITASDDKKLRIYEWNDGTGNYNGGNHHIIQFQNAKGVSYCTSYEKAACSECNEEDEDWNCRGFEVYSTVLNDKNYYIIEVTYMQALSWLGNRNIAIYMIETNSLVKKSLFKTEKEILSEIGFEYNVASYYYDFVENDKDFKNDENSFDWLFRYDDKDKIIYVPLVDGFKVMKTNLLYQWDGKYFTYKGITK